MHKDDDALQKNALVVYLRAMPMPSGHVTVSISERCGGKRLRDKIWREERYEPQLLRSTLFNNLA